MMESDSLISSLKYKNGTKTNLPLQKQSNKPWQTVLLGNSFDVLEASLTHYAVGHQSSLHEASQHIRGVVLVVRHARQAGVEGHHQHSELEQRTQKSSTSPRKSGLDIELPKQRSESLLTAVMMKVSSIQSC